MSFPQQITEIVVVYLNEGVNLEDLTSTNLSIEAQAFIESTKFIKTQNGLIRQFWGRQVENPHIFVWVFDWESYEHYVAFRDSEARASFMSPLSENNVFEISKTVMLFARVSDTEGALKAFRSSVTEVFFYSKKSRPTPDEEMTQDADTVRVIRDVLTVGKALGAAIGWVFDAWPERLVSNIPTVAAFGVFGYESIEDHWKWRETREGRMHRQHSDAWQPAAEVPGIDPKTGYFHVKFQEGM